MVDDAPPLTRSAKLATIGAILPHADKLLSEAEMLRAGKPSDAFRKELSTTIVSQVAFAPSWVGAFDTSGSRAALAENIQVLRALGQRVRTSRATTLNDSDRELLVLRSRLFVWGDFLADVATGNRVNGFHPDDVRRFVSTLPAALAATRAAVGSGESIDATFAMVEDRVDADAFSRGHAESWRAAWGLITVAYLLADKTGDRPRLVRRRHGSSTGTSLSSVELHQDAHGRRSSRRTARQGVAQSQCGWAALAGGRFEDGGTWARARLIS